LVILAVGCHPDDLELSCYGTLIKYVKAGHKVVAAHVAKGDQGHAVIKPDELVPIRNKEAGKAAKAIGAEMISLGFGDLTVDSHNPEMVKKAAEMIRYVSPDLIITHNPEDYMTDHTETGKLVYQASFGASLPHFDTAGPLAPVTPIYYMDSLAGVNFIPTEYVDITDEMDLKLKAVSMHESQVKWMYDHDGIDFLEFISACNRGRGCQCGVKYAEGFRSCINYLRMTTKRLLP